MPRGRQSSAIPVGPIAQHDVHFRNGRWPRGTGARTMASEVRPPRDETTSTLLAQAKAILREQQIALPPPAAPVGAPPASPPASPPAPTPAIVTCPTATAATAVGPPAAAPPATPHVYAPYSRRASSRLSAYWVERYERDAARNWDRFYQRNADHFFKDRHYLAEEWPQLRAAAKGEDAEAEAEAEEAEETEEEEVRANGLQVVTLLRDVATRGSAGDEGEDGLSSGSSREQCLLEAGCGVGNTLFPLLRANPRLRAFAFDFSDAAIAIVRAHPLAREGRVCAAVGDLTTGRLPPELASGVGKCDVATLMFVLSAISPERMAHAIDAVASGLAPGGLLLVRDYAQGDGAQERLRSATRPKQLDAAGRFFVRQDGTRAYYFELDELSTLVEGRGNFETLRCEVTNRTTVNKAKGVSIPRKFITATFRKVAQRAGRPHAARPAPSLKPALDPPVSAALSAAGETAEAPAAAEVVELEGRVGAAPELQLSPLEWEAAKQQMRAALDGSIGADASLQRRMLRELLDGE